MIYVPKKCVMGGLMPTDEGFMREVGVELKFDIATVLIFLCPKKKMREY